MFFRETHPIGMRVNIPLSEEFDAVPYRGQDGLDQFLRGPNNEDVAEVRIPDDFIRNPSSAGKKTRSPGRCLYVRMMVKHDQAEGFSNLWNNCKL